MDMARTTSKFPKALIVDSNSAFEAILTDIPLFCAGLTGLASVTLAFLIKRVNSSTLYLGVGTLLLFISAILDLGQLLDLQSFSVDKGKVDVSGLIVAREVGLSLAYGFVFLFAWKAVAQRRELERPASENALQLFHNARWLKLVRTRVRWITLILVISIPLLQVLWRIVPSQRQYGGLYIVENALELVTSIILIVEIILNVLVSLPASSWLPFQRCFGLVLALVTTAAVGIGNLVTFAFSEMVLGRFLRAISIYIFLLYNLITIFSAATRDRISHSDEEAPANSEKPIRLVTNDTTLRSETQTATVALESAAPAQPNDERSSLSIAASSRLSKFVSRVEPNEAFAGVTRTMSNRKSSGTPVAPKRHKRPDLRFDIMTPILTSTPEDPDLVGERRATDISLTYYTMGLQSIVAVSTPNGEGSDSPSPYGQLRGVADLQQTRASDFQASDHSFSVTPYEELMREQEELDNSIAKLGILSVDVKDVLSQEAGSTLDGSISPAGDTTTSVKSKHRSTLRTDSLSFHSDFSLSVFPTPPPPPESMSGERRFSRPMFLRRKLPQLPVDDTTQEASSVQESPVDAVMASGETHYDVTSFINILSKRNDHGTASAEVVVKSNCDVDDANPDDRPPSDIKDQKQPMMQLRPMLLPSVANERGNPPAMSLRPARKASLPSANVRFQESNATLKPLLLGTSATSIPALLPSSTMVPLRTRRLSEAKRVGKRQISAPRVDVAEVGADAFERPRRPPEHTT
ncbi:hypothetical protein Agabi119p4_597 [Agaricus bisporus var. burnettii]|uniref:Uncharacterized protein n=1 Tax=Agaricus bisporus var. burnettii TaxID=192524 RepID=A0A8H7FAU5_AGABI|nr:hypothetical protein Agabi119p4_597 [Agaricus bisporus var. burnettii]